MIDASTADLERAFREHCQTMKTGDSRGHKLIKFYAAECGIKAHYLRENGLPNTNFDKARKSKMYDNGKGHALNHWASECHISNLVSYDKGDNDSYPLKTLHERLRYGIHIPNDIEESQLN